MVAFNPESMFVLCPCLPHSRPTVSSVSGARLRVLVPQQPDDQLRRGPGDQRDDGAVWEDEHPNDNECGDPPFGQLLVRAQQRPAGQHLRAYT